MGGSALKPALRFALNAGPGRTVARLLGSLRIRKALLGLGVFVVGIGGDMIDAGLGNLERRSFRAGTIRMAGNNRLRHRIDRGRKG